MRILFLFAFFAIFSFSPAQAQAFRAGVSRIDITPQPGHPMGGYAARQGNANGTHDPLYATVLVLEGSNGEKLAWITADLRSFVSTRVGEEVRKRFGIRHTLISASHTHSGPLTWEARTSPWYARTEDQMITAAGEAAKTLEPATLSTATASVYLGFNRRKVGKDGTVTMQWRNEARLPSHPVDSQVTVLAVHRPAQPASPLTILVHYACHPTILGPDNLHFSADYPGAMREALEQAFPNTKAVFIQGGAGDINPYRDKELGPAGFAAVREAGQELAKTVAAAVRRAKPLPIESGSLRVSSEVAQVQNRWNPSSGAAIATGWSAVMLGHGAFCALTLPGEPFVEQQLAFREKAECSSSILAGYTFTASLAEGAWVGYLPTIVAAAEGGYGASYNTNAAVGTAEHLIDRGVIRLFQMRGLLKELPENAW